jgi:hypothetical protein
MAQHPNHSSMHDIVGVFGDAMIAEGVARRIVDLGVPRSEVRVGTAGARVEAMKAEMREEADNTIVGPGNVGPFTKEMTKGMGRQIVGWTIAFAIVGAVLSVIAWPGTNLPFIARLPIAVIVAAVAGATVGFVRGGGAGGAHEPSLHGLAAERGITISATVSDQLAADVVRIMRDAQPIRLDVGSVEGTPVATIETEEDAHR